MKKEMKTGRGEQTDSAGKTGAAGKTDEAPKTGVASKIGEASKTGEAPKTDAAGKTGVAEKAIKGSFWVIAAIHITVFTAIGAASGRWLLLVVFLIGFVIVMAVYAGIKIAIKKRTGK